MVSEQVDEAAAGEGLPETKVVLLQVPASDRHPGLQVRRCSQRCCSVLVETYQISKGNLAPGPGRRIQTLSSAAMLQQRLPS